MNGLAEILSINETEHQRRQDAARRAKGQKPKTPLGHSLRMAGRFGGIVALNPKPNFMVPMQGRLVTLH